jgi:hypothetical protein
MRARWPTLLGVVLVAVYAAVMVAVLVTTPSGRLRPGDRDLDEEAAEELIDAWERSRTATFIRFGTFERRSNETGAVFSSPDVLAQRPPQRLHRQVGGVTGRDDRRSLECTSAVGSDDTRCVLGEPSGPTYAEDVASEVEGLRSLLEGPSPVYAVETVGDGCFELAQLRVEPRAPFGVEARFCFDAETGAPTTHRVRHPGGVVEVLAVTEVRPAVTDAELEP